MGDMDMRTRTSLFCGVLALAIAVSVLLKGKPRLPQLFFTGLAGDIGLWYLAQWLYHVVRSDLWARFTSVLAVLLPQFAVQFFGAIIGSHFAAFFFAVQLIGGLLLLSSFFVPLALILLAAELYNILAFHLTMSPAGIAVPLVACVLWVLVFLQYRDSFSGVLATKPVTQG